MATMETRQIGQGQGKEAYSLTLPPAVWEQLQGYQQRLGLESVEESVRQLLAMQLPVQQREEGKRWLGLDPGLAVVGWAVLEEKEGGFPVVVDYGTMQTSGRHSTSQRLWELEQDLGELLREFYPVGVALEVPLRVNPQTSRGVLQAMGVIHLVCYQKLGISPVTLYPVTWKAHLGNGKADAEEVAMMIEALFELPGGKRSWDAVGIAYAGLCGVRSGE